MKINKIAMIFVGLLMLQSIAYAQIDANYTGSWYNASQSGHGFSLEYGFRANGNPFVVVYWYLYDGVGNPIFIAGSSPPDDDLVVIDFKAPHGMVYGEFNPGTVVREDGGIGTFVFTDDDNGVFDYVPSQWMVDTYGVSPVSMSIVKLAGVAHPESSAEITALQAQVDQLQALLSGLTRDIDPNTGQDTLRFTDMNVQIVSGSGTTDGEVTGTGNLIIGYNEKRGDEDNRTGSHMLVIGKQNNYSAYGGMVVGHFNTASGNFVSVSGGYASTASGNYASISGGYQNTASGVYASVSGGRENTASGQLASVSGGDLNTASGIESSVSGGSFNTARGQDASVSGGSSNTASGDYSSVSGGIGNTASSWYATVSGGYINTASGHSSSVSGGEGNNASNDYASVSGGHSNLASGVWASVIGGQGNAANNDYASVSGGHSNLASGVWASVIGGQGNEASHNYASASGGLNNLASGVGASVSGGDGNTASGNRASVSGGLGKTAAGSNCVVGDDGVDC